MPGWIKQGDSWIRPADLVFATLRTYVLRIHKTATASSPGACAFPCSTLGCPRGEAGYGGSSPRSTLCHGAPHCGPPPQLFLGTSWASRCGPAKRQERQLLGRSEAPDVPGEAFLATCPPPPWPARRLLRTIYPRPKSAELCPARPSSRAHSCCRGRKKLYSRSCP